MKQSLPRKFFNIEVIFVLFAILNIWPIWFSNYFPTVDGPSHLYNAKLIGELWNGNSFFQSFLEINQEWVPNWTGHFLLAILIKFGLPVFVAHKILLSLIALGIPLAFKKLLKELGSPITGISFFSLIFVYTFLFGMGFYNFGLGILMTLISISLYIKGRNQTARWIQIFLFLSIALCFFSHLVCFGILCVYFLVDFLMSLGNKSLKSTISDSIATFLYCLPFVILSAMFFMGREAPDVNSYFGASTLWLLFTKLKIFVLYFGDIEIILAQIVFYILILYALLALSKIFKIDKKFRIAFMLFGLLLALFFIMPDAGSNGSFISRRLLIFALWFLLIGISPVFNFKWLNAILIVFVIGIQSYRTSIYYAEIKEQEKRVIELLGISNLIQNQSIVLDLYRGQGFKESHFASYLGLNKELLILDNYEADYGYFPIKWNSEFPSIDLYNSNGIADDCIKWKSNPGAKKSHSIDYILIYGEKELGPCEKEFLKEIDANYNLIYPFYNIDKEMRILLFKKNSEAE